MFREANLYGACLDRAQLKPTSRACNFVRTNLSKAYLRNSNLTKALFVSSNLSCCVLENSQLVGAMIQHANLDRADFGGANLRGAILDGHTIDGVGLNLSVSTDFQSASFQGAALRRAILPALGEHSWRYPFSQDQLDGMFYDQSVRLPEHLLRTEKPHLTISMTMKSSSQIGGTGKQASASTLTIHPLGTIDPSTPCLRHQA